MISVVILSRAHTIMHSLAVLCLIMAVTSASAIFQAKIKSNTQSQSYSDEISKVGRLPEQKRLLDSINIQGELDKLSETLATLTRSFRKQSQNEFQMNLLRSNNDGAAEDVQNVLLSALDVMATSNVSESTCANDTALFLVSLFNREAWAIQFLDSFGKPGPGLTLGRFNFVGSYTQCRSASLVSVNGSRGYSGNYCTLKASVGPASLLGQLAIQVGVCMPDTCTELENTVFVSEVIQQLGLNGTLVAESTECHTDEREITAATIAAIILVVVLPLLMVFGTTFDIIFIQMPKWSAQSGAKGRGILTNGSDPQFHGYTVIGEEDKESASESTNLLSKIRSPEQGVCTKVLLAFSVYTNGSKVLNTSQPPGSLSAIHGIRFLSMSWVLLGHIFVFGINQVGNLASEFPVLLQRWTFDAVSNAFASVDTFFTLSGLLTAYLTLTEIKKRGLKINWALYYFHRFWRLTPPYMLTIVLVLGFQQYMGSGALWPSVQPADKVNCEKYWWTNLLYINNLVESENMCFGHSWYLANDMQFFLLSPLMFVPFFFHYGIGLAVCVGWLLISWITTGILSSQGNWPATLLSLNPQAGGGAGDMALNAWFKDYYIKPWCRIGAYVVGIIAGSYLAINNGKIKMRWYVACLGWALAVATGLAVVYGLHGDISGSSPSTPGATAFYNAVGRSAWGACVSWVIIACVSGYGGFVNTILSWSPFVVLGRLTYMAYLIHPSIMYIYFQNLEELYYITDTTVVVTFCGIVVITNMFAFVLMLALESPWIGLERTFLHKKQKE